MSLRPYGGPSMVFDIFKRELDAAAQEGGLFQLTMHPHHSGHRSRAWIIDEIIAAAKAKGRRLVCDARGDRGLLRGGSRTGSRARNSPARRWNSKWRRRDEKVVDTHCHLACWCFWRTRCGAAGQRPPHHRYAERCGDARPAFAVGQRQLRRLSQHLRQSRDARYQRQDRAADRNLMAQCRRYSHGVRPAHRREVSRRYAADGGGRGLQRQTHHQSGAGRARHCRSSTRSSMPWQKARTRSC